MTLTDEHLLRALGSALRTAPMEPSTAELDAFRLAVAQPRPAQVFAAPAARPSARASAFGRRPLTVALAAALSAVLGSGVAFAAGAPMPRAVRSVASSIGLPVDSPALVDAQHAMDRLRDALGGDDHGAIRAGRDDLRSRLGGLDPGERARLEPEAGALLRRIDLRLERTTARGPGATTSRDDPTGADPGSGPTGSREGSGGSASDDSTSQGSGSGGSGGGPDAPDSGSGSGDTGSQSGDHQDSSTGDGASTPSSDAGNG